MFNRILLAVDGSLTMASLVRCSLSLAAALGAELVAVHVAPPPPRELLETAATLADDPLAHAARIMRQIEGEAAEQAIRCEWRVLISAEPWRAILDLAATANIDLICIGAHGRFQPRVSMLGSQTARVLAGATVPVLVVR